MFHITGSSFSYLSCYHFAGRETYGNPTHCLLPDALWESPVQQPPLEELEYSVSPSDKNNWKQLLKYKGKVCTSHEWMVRCMETCAEVTFSACPLQQDTWERAQTRLQLHRPSCVFVPREAASLSIQNDWHLQRHSSHHLCCRQP